MSATPSPNPDEIRTRLSEIWKGDLSNGYRPEEVIPEEMQDHFLRKLRNAEGLAKDLQDREKVLEGEKIKLEKALAEEKRKVEELPEEHKQLIVDNKQLEHRITALKILLDNEEKRAINFEKRYKVAMERLAVAEHNKAKVETQEAEIARLQDKVDTLYKEKDELHKLNAQLEEKNKSGFEEQLGHLRQALHEADKREHKMQKEITGLREIENAHSELLSSMEAAQHLAEDQLEKEVFHIRQNAQLNIAAVSEIKTMTKYFNFSLQVLNSHAKIIKTVLEGSNKSLRLPRDHDAHMMSAAAELAGFVCIRTAIDGEYGVDPEEYEVREELGRLALTANLFQETLLDVDQTVRAFLGKLQRKPDIWATFLAKFSSGKSKGTNRFGTASM